MRVIEIEIDDEFRTLIPPPTTEELAQLEANLLEHGCLDPLVVWSMSVPEWHKCYADEVGGREGEDCDIRPGDGVWECKACDYGVAPLVDVLLDGHNRYEICKRHDIEFETVAIDLPDRDAAMLWIIRNQLGRRNLSTGTRVELALKAEDYIAAIAKANQIASLKQGDSVRPMLDERESIDTLSELAKIAGVSRSTMAKGKVIAEKAPEEVKQQVRNGETSIHAAYQDIRAREQPRTPPPPQIPFPSVPHPTPPTPIESVASTKTTFSPPVPELPRHDPLPDQASLFVDDADGEDDEQVDDPQGITEAPHFTCPACSQGFDSAVWHCTDCGQHWPLAADGESNVCYECHPADATESESPESFTERQRDDDFGEGWLRNWRAINVFLVSLPRRGGIVECVKNWSPVRIKAAIVLLRNLENISGQCATQLEDHYP